MSDELIALKNSVHNLEFEIANEINPLGHEKYYNFLMNNEKRYLLSAALPIPSYLIDIIMDYTNTRCIYVVDGIVDRLQVQNLIKSSRYKIIENFSTIENTEYWTDVRRMMNHDEKELDFDYGVDIFFPNDIYSGGCWGTGCYNEYYSEYGCDQEGVYGSCECDLFRLKDCWSETDPYIYQLIPVYSLRNTTHY